MSTIQQHYQSVTQRLQQACADCGRDPASVRLLAVSKTKPADMVEAVYNLGQRAFGENYVQDGMDKITALSHLDDIEWHFIGPLQSNKSRIVAEHFHWLETLDREKIARRLHEQRPHTMPPLNVLLQVNISGEEQKSGVLPADVEALAQSIASLDRLQLRGLMCIPEHTDDNEVLAEQFRAMKALSQQLQQQHPQADVLSMGMSGDLELAIACGSTEVRIGTDIFGARDYPASKS
ncbi:MAG: YggS family pyridoxal phosphate-dependent enzyme [Oceanospirillaceae bacterium]|uniref:YggS family pyridoxal phosphate-dependent enzyme n=1 Tax=unclassified Thalassolituus TaxID=2624967 RepID=UPI000C475EDD|nr:MULTISPECIES: YggS family pyridoxal phosphate-dependent enzyme [unclassified Thalassolituus]MAY01184.1 YggS family pyridoxal phosphate-dependent enzyme [Oceanospirillaceae bacterium]MBL35820.1 YggS family pyridoxal phosphate-dependent enzyme [Oceanospirillaceae bacterium]MBS52310.1 YggS family pyridoxal phosphate-dependent enzyme [Oceanospirillaceae bacterium]|tara:strand:- start:211 stop:915 length:705 start_codon:yes stop_codon:yes gene_type:complete